MCYERSKSALDDVSFLCGNACDSVLKLSVFQMSVSTQGTVLTFLVLGPEYYRKTSSISRTKSQSLDVSCILLQLSALSIEARC